MLGAIIGDTVGSVYEFDNIKEINFRLFGSGSTYTDDSIMSLAVAKWLMEDPSHSHSSLEKIMVDFGEQYPYPMGGYGGNFSKWLFTPDTLNTSVWVEQEQGRRPYNSWGNGSAMRASAVGWMFDDIEETAKVAKISAAITHDHPEGIKGAQAVAEAIFLARNGYSKQKIKAFIQLVHEYDLSKSCDEIRKTYEWDSRCQGTVPQAICAFLDSTDFESAIRLAVSLGGDSDTLACITGAIAEAFYKEIPQDMIYETLLRLDPPLREVLDAFALSSHYINLYGSYNKKRLARRYTPDRIQQL